MRRIYLLLSSVILTGLTIFSQVNVINEDFEQGDLGAFSMNTVAGWNIATENLNSYANSVAPNVNTYLISESLDLSIYDSLSLSYDAYSFNVNGAATVSCYLVVSTDNGNSWIAVDSVANPQASWQSFNGIDLSAYNSANVMIAFHHIFAIPIPSIARIDNVVLQGFISSNDDLELTAWSNLPDGCYLGSNEDISIEVTNVGSNPVTTFSASYTINGSTVTEAFTQNLNPTESTVITFNNKADLSNVGTYSISARVALNGDANFANDELSATEILSYNEFDEFPETEGFDSGNSMYFDINSGSNSNFAYSTTGNRAARINGIQSNVWDNSAIIDGPTAFSYTDYITSLDLFCDINIASQDLELSVDVKQNWAEITQNTTNNSWFRVLVNGSVVADTTGETYFKPDGPTDGYRNLVFSLNTYQNSSIDVKLEAVARTLADVVYIDNVKIKSKNLYDIAILEMITPESGCGLSNAETVSISLTNFGTEDIAQGEYGVQAYVDGASIPLVATGTTLNSGDTISLTLPSADFSTVGIHEIVFSAAIGVPGKVDSDPTNNSLTASVTHIPTISTFPYIENFEGENYSGTSYEGMHFWTAGGDNSSWDLGSPSAATINSAYSGDNSWATNLAGTNNEEEVSYVESPCFDFSTVQAPVLEMAIWYDGEEEYDGAFVQYNLNNAGWISIPTSSSNNWYSSLNPFFVGGEFGWMTSSGGWLMTEYDLTSIAAGANDIKFRVVFLSDANSNGNGDGFAFDNFRIYNKQMDLAVVDITSPSSDCSLGLQTITMVVENQGGIDATSFDISYSVNSGASITQTYTGNLVVGDQLSISFNTQADLSVVGNYNIEAFVSHIDDQVNGNDSYSISVISLPTYDDSNVMLEDFQANNGYWFADGVNSSWEYGSVAGGSNGWITNDAGNYNNNENSYALSPCYDFSNFYRPVIEFDYWCDIEEDYDGAYIEYTTDGNNWTILGDDGDPGTANNYYISSIIGSGLEVWTSQSVLLPGNNNGWISISDTLDNLQGESYVRFRFHFESNSSTQNAGFAFDNFNVFEGQILNDLAITAWQQPETSCGLTASEQVVVEILNLGANDVSNFTISFETELNGNTISTASETYNTLNGMSGDTYTFTTNSDFSAYGEYTCSASIIFNDDVDNSNNVVSTTIISVPTYSIPYENSFENGTDFWMAGGTNSSWDLGIPVDAVINSANTGSNAWVTNLNGMNNINENSYLVSPCLNFENTTTPTIEFYYWTDALAYGSNAIEGAALYVVEGTNETLLGNINDTAWYNSNSILALGTPGWGGSSNGWTFVKLEVPSLAGKSSVKLKFIFKSLGSTTGGGFAFDDMFIYDNAGDLEPTTITSPTSGCVDAQTGEVQFSFTNVSQIYTFLPGAEIPVSYSVNGGSVFTDIISLADSLEVGETYTHTFTQNADLSVDGTYNIEIYTDFAFDVDNTNDTTSIAIEVYPLPVITNPGNSSVCLNTTQFELTGASPTGGIYSGPGVTNGNFDPATAGLGTHTITYTYTDGNSCVSFITYEITVNDIPTVTDNITNVSCFGYSDGQITVNVSGGQAPYLYSWDGAGSISDNFYQNLSGGDYTLAIVDANGCQPDYPQFTPEVINWVVTPTLNSHTILVPNTADLTIDNNLVNFENGDYLGVFYDSLGTDICAGFVVWDNAISNMYITAWGADAGYDGFSSGESFQWKYLDASEGTVYDVTATYQSGGPFVNLGTFAVNGISGISALDGSSAGIMGEFTYQVLEPTQLSAEIFTNTVSGVNVTCFGGSNGTASASANGGSAPYSYAWSSGSLEQVATGLSAQLYTVTVTDANLCPAYASVTLTEPSDISINITNNDIACFGGTTTLDLTANGGIPPYAYVWNPGNNAEDFVGAAAGTYNVTVTDANGCTKTSTYILGQPDLLTVSISGDEYICNGETTDLLASATGGNGGYFYFWSGGGPFTAEYNGVSAQTYSVNVVDSKSCFASETITINESNPILISGDVTNVSCNGLGNGMIDLSVTGGEFGSLVFTRTYDWDNGETTEDISGLVPGTYVVIVKDSLHEDGTICTVSESFTITQPNALEITSSSITPVDCNGNATGSIDISVNGGTQSYEFIWSNTSSTQNISGLLAGKYYLTINDANSCQLLDSFDVTEPNLLTVSISGDAFVCNGETTDLTASAQGGNGSYSYTWNVAGNGELNNGLAAGNYDVTVIDSKSCSATDAFTITESNPILISGNVTNVSCNGLGNGLIDLSVTGGEFGSLPFTRTFEWDNGETTEDISGLSPDTYVVIVKDSLHEDGTICIETESFTITQPDILEITSAVVLNAGCFGNSSGSINITVAGGTTPYSYDWSNSSTDEDITGLSAGNYSVIINDANSCSVTDAYVINEPAAPLEIEISGDSIICIGETTTLTCNATGGTAPYIYFWNGGQLGQSTINVSAGQQAVFVQDSKGCPATAGFYVNEVETISFNETITDVSCFTGNDGIIELNPAGGTHENMAVSYAYNWDNSVNTSINSGLVAGTYAVTVTSTIDVEGTTCSSNTSFTVSEPTLLEISGIEVENSACVGLGTGEAVVSVTGGTPLYSYIWDNGDAIAHATNLTYGWHVVTVTDLNSCFVIDSAFIDQSMSVPFTEDFTAGVLPAKWSLANDPASFGWEIGDDLYGDPMFGYFDIPAHDGNYATSNDDYHDDMLAYADTIKLPLIEFPNASVYYLQFDAYFASNFGFNVSNADVIASVDGGHTWQNIFVVPMNDDWTTYQVNVSQLAQNCAIQFAFVHNDNNMWSTMFAIDNIYIDEFADNVGIIAYVGPNGPCHLSNNEAISITLENTGVNPATNFNVSFEVNGIITTEQYTASIAAGTTENYTSTSTFDFSLAQDYDINIWVDYNLDNFSSNDTLSGIVITSSPSISVPYLAEFNAEPIEFNSTVGTNASLNVTGGELVFSGVQNFVNWTPVDATTAWTLNLNKQVSYETKCTFTAPVNPIEMLFDLRQTATNDVLRSWFRVLVNGSAIADVTGRIDFNPQTISGDLPATVVYDLSAYANQDVSIEFQFVGDKAGDAAYVDNLIIQESQYRVAATNLISPVSDCGFLNVPVKVTIENLSNVAVSNFDILLEVDGNVYSETVSSVIQPSATYDYTFIAQPVIAAYGEYNYVVYTEFAEMVSDTLSEIVVAKETVIGLEYFQDNTDVNWTSGGTNSSWMFVSGSFEGQTACWTTNNNGNYNDNENSYVEGPCFDLSSMSHPALSMNVWYNIESDDGVSIQISQDGGATWDVVGAIGDNLNWYNNVVSGDVWNGISSGWLNVIHELPYNVASAKIRVVLNSDASGNNNGFAFDDFRIFDLGDIGVVGLTSTANICGNVSDDISVEVKNFSASTIPAGTSIPIVFSGSYTASFSETLSTDLLAGDTITLIHSGAVLNNIGAYSIYANTNLFMDADVSNNQSDELAFNVNGYPTASHQNVVDVLCTGDATGAFTAIGSSVVPNSADPMTYSIDGSNYQTSALFDNLTAGIYNLSVMDVNGCVSEVDDMVTISEPATVVSVSASNIVNNVCFGASEGSFEVTGNGGVAPYQFDISGTPQSGTIFSGLASGTYIVTITDANDCSDVSTIIEITSPIELTLQQINIENVLCTGDGSGSIEVGAMGGIQPYTYTVNGGFGQTSGLFESLIAGTYNFTVTDANGCIAVLNGIEISEPTQALSATITKFSYNGSDISCFGAADGSLTVNPVGGTGQYDFEWNTNGTVSTISNLDAGQYTVTVTDDNDCNVSVSALINNPIELVVFNIIDNSQWVGNSVSCNGASDGEINLITLGGTGNLTYLWSNGSTIEDLSGVPADNYLITVTDANSCTAIDSISLSEPEELSVSMFEITNLSCNASSNGAIEITMAGGNSPYNFLWSNGQSTKDITGLSAGSYSVTITDVNNCNLVESYNVTEPNILEISSVNVTDVDCNGNFTGALDISVAGGTSPYSFDWSNGETSEDIAGLLPNSYYVDITDVNGCFVSDTFTVVEPDVLTVSISSDTTICFNTTTNIASLVNGGNTSFTYNWSNGVTTASNDAVPSGYYSLTVTDNKGCFASDDITIIEASEFVISGNAIDVSCFGYDNGEVSVMVTGGEFNSLPYTTDFIWSNGETTQNVTNLGPGTFTVTVSNTFTTEGSVCSGIENFTINEPSLLTVVTNNITDVTCNGGSDGVLDVTVAGGITPYTYIWTDGYTTEDISNLTAKTYKVTVTDANGCQAFLTDIINEPVAITSFIESINVSCNGGSDGSADLTVMNAVPTVSFNWTGNINSEDLSNLSAGTYDVTITDANNCVAYNSVTITEPVPIAFNEQINDNLCFNDANGSIFIIPTNGTAPYNYLWTTGSTTSSISGLAEGYYKLTVTDAEGCSNNDSFYVAQPGLIVPTYNAIDLVCSGGIDGGATLTNIVGGTPGFSYLWSNGTTNQDLSGVIAGSYTVTITDANFCTVEDNVVVNEPVPTVFTIDQTMASCNGLADGELFVNHVTGNAPYTYLWSDGQTTNPAIGLSAGTYSVSVFDVNNCLKIGVGEVTEYSQIYASVSVLSNFNTFGVQCNGNTDGEAQVVAIGGDGNYTYTWSTGQTTDYIDNLGAGTYEVTVTDGNGCIAIPQSNPVPVSWTYTVTGASHIILIPDTIDLTINSNPISIGDYIGVFYTNGIGELECGGYTQWSGTTTTIAAWAEDSGMDNGFASNEVFSFKIWRSADGVEVDAVASYISDGSFANTNMFTTNGISGLSELAGTTTILAPATNLIINITEPDALTYSISTSDFNGENISCIGASDGYAEISVSGGLSPYTYEWSNNVFTYNNSGLSQGSYDLTVTDQNGCTIIENVTFVDPAPIAYTSALTHVTIGCYGDNIPQGEILIDNITGGTGAPYEVEFSNGFIGNSATQLIAGNYSVTITDAFNCSVSETFTINQPDSLVTNINVPTPIACYGGTGEAVLEVSGGTTPYNVYPIGLNIGDTIDFSANNPLLFSMVLDANGCFSTASYVVSQPEMLEIASISQTDDVLCNGDATAAATVEAIGGTAPYSYTWSNGASTQSISQLSAGMYYVTISDLNDCEIFDSILIEEPDVLAINIDQVDILCNDAATGSAEAIAYGGTAPYSYSWSNGETTSSVSGLMSGVYNLTVTDANLCEEFAQITINQSPAISVVMSSTDVSCYSGMNGTASALVSGGTSPYSYIWSNGNLTESISNIAAGMYYVTVTDSLGCEVIESIEVFEPSEISLTYTQSEIPCYGQTADEVDITITGGTQPYTSFNWSSGEQTEDLTFVHAGNYTVTVTDANNCNAAFDVTVVEPDELSILGAAQVSHISCNGLNNGALAVNESNVGGTSPYSYWWGTTSGLNLNDSLGSSISNLTPGFYFLLLTDANGCNDVQTITLIDPAPLNVSYVENDVTNCYNANNGSIDVTVTGGTAPISYFWSDGESTQDRTGLDIGSYSVTILDNGGCSVVIPNIQITAPAPLLSISVSTTDVQCYGESTGMIDLTVNENAQFNWSNGETTEDLISVNAGVYSVIITDDSSCMYSESIEILQPLTPITNSISDVICEGTSYMFGTQNLISTGIYTEVFTASNGCDSTVTLDLTVNQGYSLSEDVSICNGEIYNWHGTDYSAAGTYTENYTTINGCDSVYILNLTVNPVYSFIENITICEGDVYNWHGVDYTMTGIYNEPNSSIYGCDSNYTLNLNVVPVFIDTIYVDVCYGDSYFAGGAQQTVSGNYTDVYQAVNGCDSTIVSVLTVNPLPSVTAFASNPSCNGANNGFINITIGGIYSGILWSDGQTSPYVSGLSSGSYTVTVTNTFGCETIEQYTLTDPDAINIVGNITDAGCSGDSDGSIDLAVSGGLSPYTFSWSNGSSSMNIENLAEGTYTVTVTDANNCTEIYSANVNATNIVVSANVTQPACVGDYGSIDITPSGGVSPYNYSWLINAGAPLSWTYTQTGISHSIIISPNTVITINGAPVSNGSYIGVFFENNNGDHVCGGYVQYNGGATFLTAWGQDGTTPGFVTGDEFIFKIWNATDQTVYEVPTTGTVYSIGGFFTGGNFSPNAYSQISTMNATGFSGSINTQDISGLTAGTYYLVIEDASGCSVTESFVINPASAVEIGLPDVIAICDGENYIIDAGNFASYQWSTGATTQALNVSMSGIYEVTVTTPACSASDEIQIVVNPVYSQIANIEICEGDIIEVGGGMQTTAGTYVDIYQSVNGCDSVVTTNLTVNPVAATSLQVEICNGESYYAEGALQTLPGVYTDVYQTTLGCDSIVSTTLSIIPSPVLAASIVDPTCNGGSDGVINVTIGGTQNPVIEWSTGETIPFINNLSAGTYTVSVTNSMNCTTTESYTLVEPDMISYTFTTTDISCYGQTNGEATISVEGGTSPYSYIWSNGDLTMTSTNLAGGTYFVTLIDANSCSSVASVDILQPNPIIANGVVSEYSIFGNTYNVSDFGMTDGSIDVTVSGGTTPYQYSWSNGASTQNLSGLNAGTYSLTIVDANSCSTILSFTLVEPSSTVYLSAQIVSDDAISCNGGSNGSAHVDVLGGQMPYTYLWSTGGTDQSVSGLSAGQLSVTVTDANTQSIVQTTSIVEPAPVVVNLGDNLVLCTTTQITLDPGVFNSYTWSNGATTQGILVTSGSYAVTVTDANGCSGSDDITISVSPVMNISSVITDVSCVQNGSIDVNLSGGVAPYTYNWSNGVSSEDLSNIADGNYDLTIIDSYGCEVSESFSVIFNGVNVTASANGVTCFGDSDGSANIVATGGVLPYSYIWSNGATTDAISSIVAGIYTVTLSDAAGCQIITNIEVETPDQLTVTAVQDFSTQAIAMPLGGTAPYFYHWTGPNNYNVYYQRAKQLVNGNTYFVTVTDINGCTAVDSITINSSIGTKLISFRDESMLKDNFKTGDIGDNFDVYVYPNPSVNGIFTLDISELDFENLKIEVLDEIGRKVYNNEFNSDSMSELQIILDEFDVGLYHLRLIIDGEKLVVKKLTIIE